MNVVQIVLPSRSHMQPLARSRLRACTRSGPLEQHSLLESLRVHHLGRPEL